MKTEPKTETLLIKFCLALQVSCSKKVTSKVQVLIKAAEESIIFVFHLLKIFVPPPPPSFSVFLEFSENSGVLLTTTTKISTVVI